MSRNRKKNKGLSLDEECLMWTSYRYCIGRHTYVSDMAYYIAKKYYPLLSERQMAHAALDIRREILTHLSWSPLTFRYEGSVPESDRKPLEDLFQWMTDNEIDSEEKILSIDRVEVYRESYKEGTPNKYYVTKRDPDSRRCVSQMDLDDLIPWARLASLFDRKNYKKVTFRVDNGEEEVICFETWTPDMKKVEGSENTYQHWPWHWKKVYTGVEHFINDGSMAGYMIPENIVSVEDYDGREEISILNKEN